MHYHGNFNERERTLTEDFCNVQNAFLLGSFSMALMSAIDKKTENRETKQSDG